METSPFMDDRAHPPPSRPHARGPTGRCPRGRAARALGLSLSLFSCAPATTGPASAVQPAAEPATPARPAPAEATPPEAAPKKVAVVAVFDVADGTERLSTREVGQLGDYLSARVASIPDIRVVPREQLRTAITAAKAESYRSCFDQSCQIELGKAVSAEKSLAAKLLRVGSRCAMTAELFDLVSETTDRAASVKTDCTADALFGAIDELVGQLGGAAPRLAMATGADRTGAPDAARGASTTTHAGEHAEAPPLELRLDESTGGSPPAEANPSPVPSAAGVGERAAPSDARPTSTAQLRFSTRRGHRNVVLSAPVTFAPGADTLDPGAKRALGEVARALTTHPGLRRERLEIVGHADANERGKAELSERRARNARAFLVAQGVGIGQLLLVAAADTDPLAPSGKGAGGAMNRRVELRLAEDE